MPLNGDEGSAADEAFFRMVRLAARDPLARSLFVSIVEAAPLPVDERAALLVRFMAAGLSSATSRLPGGH